jgi:hypothetical protein
VLIEVKNYSRTGPRDEIDKFERDTDSCRAAIGLMVSLDQSIQGKRRVDVERVGNRLHAFICISNSDMLLIALVVRALLATQCVFQKSRQAEHFNALATTINDHCQQTIAEVARYAKYNAKHYKSIESIMRDLPNLGSEL